jgi:hypothetical protein
MKKRLLQLKLNESNCIVIGSGILQALKIRNSKDIDIITSENDYKRLKESKKFSVQINQYNKEILTDDHFEIGTNWEVLNKRYTFDDFKNDSIVIDEVRYLSLDFLYRIKANWIKEGKARPKDIIDIELIENYYKTK